MESHITPAASAANYAQPPMGAAAGLSSTAADGGAAASHSIGAAWSPFQDSAPTGGAGASNASTEQYGPLTTTSPDGAGGPLNRFDREIAHWRSVGKPHLAEGLQRFRARTAIAFQTLEPVFVPTDAQRAMYGLRAGAARDGVCTKAAA